MFKLDIVVFNAIYRQCKVLGSLFHYGAFEGFVIYLGVITITALKVINSKKKVVKK